MLKTILPDTPIAPGLFSVQIDIGGTQPGTPSLHISLTVNESTKQLTGTGQLKSGAFHHSFGLNYLKGYYFSSPASPIVEFPNVLIIMGMPYLAPPYSNVVPQPNMEIFLELDNAWKSGFCTYKYETDGAWLTVAKAPAGFMEPRMLAAVV
ncbi:DUF1842 domain-containing protein [Chitinophaga sp. NPDC101104]|uniref:DUF1842 domain-containing protein n=1 Tax=Chitinophaga sp. NPDC101104 TaxID=3390561 RepID=UPI003D04AD9E